MDSLTHALTGAIIGDAIAGQKVGRKAMLIGAFAANIPDLDVLALNVFNSVDALFVHRGFSHSILLMILGSAALAYLLNKRFSKRLNFTNWWLLILIPWFSHVSMDIFNTYGTAIFEPFSNTRVSIDSMAIIDLNLLVILLLSLFGIFLTERKPKFKRFLSLASLFAVILYFVAGVLIKAAIEREVKLYLTQNDVSYNRIYSTPVPLTNLAWMVLVEDSASFRVSYINVPKNQIYKHFYIKKDFVKFDCPVLEEKLVDFSKGFYAVKHDDGKIFFTDLRFSTLAEAPKNSPVLSIEINPNSCKASRNHPKRDINLKNAAALYRRLF